MTMNDVWLQLKDFKQQTDCNLYRLRWYLRLMLAFSAATTLMMAAFFGGFMQW